MTPINQVTDKIKIFVRLQSITCNETYQVPQASKQQCLHTRPIFAVMAYILLKDRNNSMIYIT